jgi:hypothetical protein
MYMICICTNLLLCTPMRFYKYYLLCYEYYLSRVITIVEITCLSTELTIEFVLMAQRLDRMSISLLKCAYRLGSKPICNLWSMSVLKCASSLCLNPFAAYVKAILSGSAKTHTLTELLINRVCQLTLSSHNNILNHRQGRHSG